jgi:hypothetical protein
VSKRAGFTRLSLAVLVVVALALVGLAQAPLAPAAVPNGDLVTWSGTVRTSTGIGVPGVLLQINGRSGEANFFNSSTVTDARGAFVVAVPPGSYQVRGSLESGAAFQLPDSIEFSREFSFAESTAEDVVLPAAATVTVRVRDANGSPVSGAPVFLACGGSANGDGGWAFDGGSSLDAPTDVAGVVVLRTFVGSQLGFTSRLGNPTVSSVDAGGGCRSINGPTVYDIAFPATVRWVGVLRTAAGVPVPGVRLNAYTTDGGSSSVMTTAADGAFTMELPAGRTVGFGGTSSTGFPGRALGLPDFVTFTGRFVLGGDLAYDLTLPPTTATTATVRDHEGNPVEGAKLMSTNGSRSWDSGLPGNSQGLMQFRLESLSTDANGTATVISFDQLVGPLQLSAEHTTDTGAALRTPTVTVDPFGEAPSLTLPRPARWQGVLRTAGGAPVSGVQLVFQQSGSSAGSISAPVTGPDGRFVTDLVAGRQFLLQGYTGSDFGGSAFGIPDSLGFSGSGTVSDDIVQDLQLPPVVTVTARVLRKDGTPVAGARVGWTTARQHASAGIPGGSVAVDGFPMPRLTGSNGQTSLLAYAGAEVVLSASSDGPDGSFYSAAAEQGTGNADGTITIVLPDQPNASGAPNVDVRVPTARASFQPGEIVHADFDCPLPHDAGTADSSWCAGSTADGAALPTNLGVHVFSATASLPGSIYTVRVIRTYIVADTAAGELPPSGGTVETSTVPTVDDPIQTRVTAPAAGSVTIVETGTTTTPPSGYAVADQEVEINAPSASVDDPLMLRFRVHASTLQALGLTPATVQVLRDGVPVADCTNSGTRRAEPDACVFERVAESGGDSTVGVYSSHASRWTFARKLPVTPPGLAITTTSISGATLGHAFSKPFTATAGTAPYKWRKVGALPKGLKLGANGVLSGTPTVGGAYSFRVEVKDKSKPVQTATRSFTMTVSTSPLTISTASLPSATRGHSYSASIVATGGTAPYKWKRVGKLPAGLKLNASSGVISGTPKMAGSSTFSVQVKDKSHPIVTRSKAFAITVG